MNKWSALFIFVILLLGGNLQAAQAGLAGKGGPGKRFFFPRLSAKASGVQALIKQQYVTHVTSSAVMRKTFFEARRNFTGPQSMLQRARQSLVQVSLPQHSAVLGTGVVIKAADRVWIAMPYHLGGAAGGMRTVRVLGKDGNILEQEVRIALNGAAGWHAPDVSLVELPPSWKGEVNPLEIAPADVQKEVYSVGYVSGRFGMKDWLPVLSRFSYVDRENMLRDFHIPGATLQNPISGSGYCGSALLQEIDGEWKIVGLHNGHSMDLTNPPASIGSSVNLSTTLPQMIDNYISPMAMGRGLAFRGWEITRLGEFESVDTITVVFSDGRQEPVVRYIRNLASPYADAYAEQAVGDLDLQSGDKLIFLIKGRTPIKKRASREVEFIIP